MRARKPAPPPHPPDPHPPSPVLPPELLRILAHQLKSPINTLESFLKTLQGGLAGELNPRALYFIDKAVGKTTEARRLITDLLLFAQFADGDEAPREEVELVELVRALTRAFHGASTEKELALGIEGEPRVRVILRGSRTGLEHALRNLLDNAIKYTPAHGRVTVRLGLGPRRGRVRVQVSDTGSGISQEEIPHLFEPFHRSARHKGQISGTGLGLAIVRQIVLAHGGSIAVESTEGRGTVFTLDLPVERTEREAAIRIRQREVVIIGGVTAGPKLAARLRRLDESVGITIVEKSDFLSYSGCGLPAYVAGQVASPKALMSTTENSLRDVTFFEGIKNIRVRNRTEAVAVDRKKRRIRVLDLATRTETWLPYDQLVLATGAVPAVPDIPGIREPGVYSLYRIEDAEALKGRLAQGAAQDVHIIGGGLIGVEISESLAVAGARVTILEREDHILFNLMDRDVCLQIQKELNLKGIKTVPRCAVQAISRSDGGLTLRTDRGIFAADFVLLSAGVRPNAELARAAGLKLAPSGGIHVNRRLQTSDPRIYAVGDCAATFHLTTGREAYWPLGSVSIKMGRIAADNLAGRRKEFRGSLGTAMFKLFDSHVGRTGLTTERAREEGYDVESVTVAGLDRAYYYPQARFMTLKVLADRGTRVLLGAQGFGRGNVVPRLQVLASAIAQGLTLEDVFAQDLGYFPAYNTPIDLLQTACLVLANKLDGLLRSISREQFERRRLEFSIVDVSTMADYDPQRFPRGINIPLENLRQEGIPFPPHARVLLVSMTSSRAYEAYRILSAHGHTDLTVLEGGYFTCG